MHVYSRVRMYMCLSLCMCIYTHVYTYEHVHELMCVQAFTGECVHMNTCILVFVFVGI